MKHTMLIAPKFTTVGVHNVFEGFECTALIFIKSYFVKKHRFEVKLMYHLKMHRNAKKEAQQYHHSV